MSAVARRYARGAVAAAEEKGGAKAVEQLLAGMSAFRDAYRASSELREVLVNPALEPQRKQVLEAVLGKLGLGDQARALVRLLTDADRIAVLDEVVVEVQAIADERAGRVRATVESAVPLTDAQVKRISRALERRVGHKVVVSVEVDPLLLGGLVCRVGDLTLDTSLRHQLQVLREQLEGHSN